MIALLIVNKNSFNFYYKLLNTFYHQEKEIKKVMNDLSDTLNEHVCLSLQESR